MADRWVAVVILLSAFVIRSVFLQEIDDSEGVAQEDPAEIYNKTYAEHMTALHSSLFQKYDRTRRPVLNQSESLEVYIHMQVMHAVINAKQQSMTLHGHIYMTWLDQYLRWNPSDFNGVATTHMKQWQIWQPEIKVANSIGGVYESFEIARNSHVTVESVGKVSVEPTFSIKVGCKFDFSDYPNDDHTCSVLFFTLPRMDEIILKTYPHYNPTISLAWGNQSTKTTIGDFRITSVSNNVSYVTYNSYNRKPVLPEEYKSTWTLVSNYISFKRVAASYGIIVVLPLFVASLLSTCSCLIQSLAYALLVNIGTLILHIVFLHEFISRIPMTVTSMPWIVIFYCFSMAFTSLLAFFHLFLIVLVRRRKTATNIFNDAVAFAASGLPFLEAIKCDASSFSAWYASLHEYRAWMALVFGVLLLKSLVLINLF